MKKILIAIPAMDMMQSWTARCLMNLRHVGECEAEWIIRMQVDMARNVLAQRAIERGFDRILWIDSDMTFEPDLMERLDADLDEGWDVVSGLYFKRTFPAEPVLYKAIDPTVPKSDTYWDYPRDSIFPAAGFGFGGVMMRVDAIADMEEPPFLPFANLSEDLSFCVRMAERGKRMACDSRIKLGHMGMIVFGEKMYKHPD